VTPDSNIFMPHMSEMSISCWTW